MKLPIDVLKSLLINPKPDHRGKNLSCRCPWCEDPGEEFGVSIEDGHRFNCYRKKACGVTGNIYILLKKIGRLDLLSNSILPVDISVKLENIIEKKLESNLDLSIENISLPIGFRSAKDHLYLQERNFYSYHKYDVGITKLDPDYKNYVIFPITESSEIKGFVARHIWDKEKIDQWNKNHPRWQHIVRYNNSKSDFSKLLGGYEEITNKTETIILVEGLFDKDNVDKHLLLDEVDDIKCCCTFGAKISEEQVLKLQLKGIQNIIVMFDPDAINKIKKYLFDIEFEFETVKAAPCVDNTDPGDMSLEQIKETMENLTTPLEYFLNKVQVLRLK